VRVIGSLNPKRYRVEHIFDLSEALLRAEIVLAHALVIYTEEANDALLRQCRNTAERLTTVFVSPQIAARDIATELDGRFVQDPFEVPDLKRAVYRAVSKTEEQRQQKRKAPIESSVVPMQRVIVMCTVQVKGAVISAVVRDQLQVNCEVASNASEALHLLEEPVDALIAEVDMLMGSSEGAVIARLLTRRGVPVIPLRQSDQIDVADAGQAAWDVLPQLRRSLTARSDATERTG
jgi:DNA-binding NtrC family response regulator